METSEVLNRAADLIEERGWTQGSIGWGDMGPGSKLCLEGGIAAALGTDAIGRREVFTECPAYLSVRAHLGLTEGWEDVYDFNDEPDRTASEVIEVLRACAVIEAAREEQDAAWETYAGLVTA